MAVSTIVLKSQTDFNTMPGKRSQLSNANHIDLERQRESTIIDEHLILETMEGILESPKTIRGDGVTADVAYCRPSIHPSFRPHL